MSLARAALVLALAALLAGCASGPAMPPLQLRAAEANQLGLDQLAQGDAERALASFERALQLEQSIEREEGIARAWYNVSVAHQRLGRDVDAARALDAVLLDDVRDYPPLLLAEIAFRKAVLAMAARDTAAATRALDQTRGLCAGKCPLSGPMANLGARVALEEKRFEDALAHLADAASRNRKDPVESANTFRLQAATLIALGRADEASRAAAAALAIDKRLGQGPRIYQDLMLLAQAAPSPTGRRDFLMRAGDVARAQGDQAGLERTRKLLARIDPVSPTVPEGVP